MKRTIAIIVSLIFVFAISAVSFAAEKTAAPATAPAAEKKAAPAPTTPAAVPVEKKEAAPAAKKIQVTGEVAAVDAKANTVTVKGQKGDVTVSVNDKTKILADKDNKTLADVKTGNKVTVKYVEAEGKKVATKISILPAAAAEKKDAAPAVAPAKAEEKKPAAAKKPAAGY